MLKLEKGRGQRLGLRVVYMTINAGGWRWQWRCQVETNWLGERHDTCAVKS